MKKMFTIKKLAKLFEFEKEMYILAAIFV